MACWAYTKSESSFYQIFGDRRVPIRSIVPFTPREQGSPLCYEILCDQLEEEQLMRLSEMLYEKWQPECQSLDQAREYCLKGLPLQTHHFTGVSSNDYFMMPGIALNAALHFAQNERDLENF